MWTRKTKYDYHGLIFGYYICGNLGVLVLFHTVLQCVLFSRVGEISYGTETLSYHYSNTAVSLKQSFYASNDGRIRQ